MDLQKLMDNRKKACFLGKQHSLEATCSVLSFISRCPATRRHRTMRYKIYSNRTLKCAIFGTKTYLVNCWLVWCPGERPERSHWGKSSWKKCWRAARFVLFVAYWEIVSEAENLFDSTLSFIQVHFMRSVKCVSQKLNKSSPGHQAYTTIGCAIPKYSDREEVQIFFDILSRAKEIEEAIKVIPDQSCLKKYAPSHDPTLWKPAEKWCQCWTCEYHLRKYTF